MSRRLTRAARMAESGRRAVGPAQVEPIAGLVTELPGFAAFHVRAMASGRPAR